VSFLLFTAATVVIGIFAMREARDLSTEDRWLVAATFGAMLLVLLANKLRPFGSREFRDRAGRIGNRAFMPLVAVTAVLVPMLPGVLSPLLLAAAAGATASIAALAGYGLARDIADKNDARG
jgi:hypothetical protein